MGLAQVNTKRCPTLLFTFLFTIHLARTEMHHREPSAKLLFVDDLLIHASAITHQQERRCRTLEQVSFLPYEEGHQLPKYGGTKRKGSR